MILIPASIRPTIWNTYTPHPATTNNLLAESSRRIRCEDISWSHGQVEPLRIIAIRSVAKYFKYFPAIILDEIIPCDSEVLLEFLDPELPIDLTVGLIGESIFWQRSVEYRWPERVNCVRDYGKSYKRMYLERHLEEYLEKTPYEDFKEQGLIELAKLCGPYIIRLKLRQMQVKKQPPLDGTDECSIESPPTDHVNLDPVLRHLPNLRELDLCFTVRNVAKLLYNVSLFQLSVEDCKNVASALPHLTNLEILRIQKSEMDDYRVTALLQGLVTNVSLIELDFSHCIIGNEGAKAIGKILTVHPTIQRVELTNNLIGSSGAAGLAYAITHLASPLETISFRLNNIQDKGLEHLCAALVVSARPKHLIISGCGLGYDSAVKLGQMFQQNRSLLKLDASNNDFGPIGGQAIELGIRGNNAIQEIDLRMTGIDSREEKILAQLTRHNRYRFRRDGLDYESVTTVLGIEDMEEEQDETEEIIPSEESSSSATVT